MRTSQQRRTYATIKTTFKSSTLPLTLTINYHDDAEGDAYCPTSTGYHLR